jgi:hypothetical protein
MPVACTRWLQSNVLGQFGRVFVIQGIDGAQLLQLSREDLFAKVGMEMTKKEKAQIWQLVSELQNKGAELVKDTVQKSKEKAGNLNYRAPGTRNIRPRLSFCVPSFRAHFRPSQRAIRCRTKCLTSGTWSRHKEIT